MNLRSVNHVSKRGGTQSKWVWEYYSQQVSQPEVLFGPGQRLDKISVVGNTDVFRSQTGSEAASEMLYSSIVANSFEFELWRQQCGRQSWRFHFSCEKVLPATVVRVYNVCVCKVITPGTFSNIEILPKPIWCSSTYRSNKNTTECV